MHKLDYDFLYYNEHQHHMYLDMDQHIFDLYKLDLLYIQNLQYIQVYIVVVFQ